MNKIYALIGKSGSGKDTLQDIISQTTNAHKVILTTTRPIRENEIDGESYNFITNEQFNKRRKDHKMIAAAAYGENSEWQYGVDIDAIDNFRDNIVVLSPLLYEQVKIYYGEDKVIGIVVHYSDKERVLAALTRENDPDVHEICRRFLSDEKDFEDIEHDFTVYHVHNKHGDLSYALSQIKFIMNLLTH